MRNIVPNIIFKTRVRDDAVGGENPYRWQDFSTDDYFKDKRVVVFSLPGAFTPTCSTKQVPGFEQHYDRIRNAGIDEVYCISVNDSYVMNKWARDQKLAHIKMIPDGNGDFTRMMGMLVDKRHEGFGMRSWRYAMVVNNGVIEQLWEEPGINNSGADDDPYGQTTPEAILQYLENTM